VTIIMAVAAGLPQAQPLELWFGSLKQEVNTRTRDGTRYFRLRDLAGFLELELRESDFELEVVGPRGTLVLLDGRPLVRQTGQYILLSSRVWRRGNTDWYVPLDFLEKVLPNILSRRLIRQRDGSIRVDDLGRNRVRVEVIERSGRVSVVFVPSEKTSVTVREFHDFIEVAFGDSLVEPELDGKVNTQETASSVTFHAEEAYGSFHIHKGEHFSRFQERRLLDPPRIVVDLVRRSGYPGSGGPPGGGSPGTNTTGERTLSFVPDDPLSQGSRESEIVVIDPGHGAADYGVDVFQDVLEKVVALNMARRLEAKLARRGLTSRLTRIRDVQLKAENRSAISNYYQASVFVAIHAGGAPSPETRGAVVYFYAPTETGPEPVQRSLAGWYSGQSRFLDKSRLLANMIQTDLNRLFEVENLVVESQVAVLAPVLAPAVLIEAGFLTNPADLALLGTPGFQEEIAAAVADTLIDFLRNQ
jgi:N-acetylmuramoyl-L-alanine amidase